MNKYLTLFRNIYPCHQVDELDFLSVLGLTRVETTEPRRWRLWHPEDEVDEVIFVLVSGISKVKGS